MGEHNDQPEELSQESFELSIKVIGKAMISSYLELAYRNLHMKQLVEVLRHG